MTAPPVTSQRLLGKRVIVTGGARGIGGEIAARFAVEGARVGILDRLAEQGAAHAVAIGGQFHEVDLARPCRPRHPSRGPRSTRSAASTCS